MSIFYNYILVTETGTSSYVGYTKNFDRRLRQHRKEITGGAKYTCNLTTRGERWVPLVVVTGCPNSTLALQFEYAQKSKMRKWRQNQVDVLVYRRIQASSLHHRLKTLLETLHMRTWTKLAKLKVEEIELIFHWSKPPPQEWFDLLPSHLRHEREYTTDI